MTLRLRFSGLFTALLLIFAMTATMTATIYVTYATEAAENAEKATVLSTGSLTYLQNSQNSQNPTEQSITSAILPYERSVSVPGILTIAGTGSHGAVDGGFAQFNLPIGISGTADGGLIIADTFNNLIRIINAYHEVTTIAGSVGLIGADNFPLGAYHDGMIGESSFRRPSGAVLGHNNRIYIADTLNHAIRAIIGDRVFTIAGGLGAGHTDGNRHEARFNAPGAIAICPSGNGNIFVADTLNHVIRKITPAGYTTTIAGVVGVYGYANGRASEALFDSPMGIVVTDDGRIFVADTGNHVIRLITMQGDMQVGEVTTFAGQHVVYAVYAVHSVYSVYEYYPIGGFVDGAYAVAMFTNPMGLALWNGYVIVADSGNHAIRAISPNGYTTTIAGTGLPGYTRGIGAQLHSPMGVYVRNGVLYIADTGNNKIRTLQLHNTAITTAITQFEGNE